MAEGRKPVLDSHQDASRLLSAHLQETRHRSRRRSPLPPPTEKEVKEELLRILNEFLKKQLVTLQDGKPAIPTGYQNVTTEETIETDGPTSSEASLKRRHENGSRYSSKASCAKCREESGRIISPQRESNQTIPTGSIHSLTGEDIDFPFADEGDDLSIDEHSERSKSLPSEILSSIKDKKPNDSLSKSLSPSHLKGYLNHGTGAKIVHEKVANIEEEDSSKHIKTFDYRPSKSKSSSPYLSDYPVDRPEPGICRRRFKSGTESSEDNTSCESVVSPDRKKKSVFTRLKERMNRSLSRGRKNDSFEERVRSQSDGGIKKRRKPRIKNKKSKSKHLNDGSTVLEEVRKHQHGHVEQHHYSNGSRTGIMREEDIWESTDKIQKSKHKHREKHHNVKESTELSDEKSDHDIGIIGRLKKMTSFRKSKKPKPSKSMKESKSPEIRRDHKKSGDTIDYYERSVSVDPTVNEVVTHRGDDGNNYSGTTTITATTSRGIIEGDRAAFDGTRPLPLGLNEGSELENQARNKSFILDFESDEVRRKRLMPDGKVDEDVKTTFHINRYLTDDVDIDGHSDEGSCPHHSPSDEEREKLYAKIAERLANIGDSYMATSPLSDSGAGSSTDNSLLRNQQMARQFSQTSGSDERDGQGLTRIERELLYSLRDRGDTYNTQMNLSPESVQNAAVDILKHATYETFKETVNHTIGDGTSWDKIAAVFYLTKKAVNIAGTGGAVAMHIKDVAAEYVADKFAKWIVDQGGWDTCLEEEDTDVEID